MISDKTFKELQTAALEIWHGYDDAHGYATEKKDRVARLQNYSDNYGTIIGMFDHKNQRKLYNAVGEEAKQLIDNWVGGLDRVEAMAEEFGL